MGGLRYFAWGTVDFILSGWPPSMRLIVRKERPHPGAQLRFTDRDELRLIEFVTNTAKASCPTWNYGTAGGLAARIASAPPRTQGCGICRSTASTPTAYGSKSSCSRWI